MNKKEIFKKIGSIIVEINEQYQYLSDNPDLLNDLELELFSANADFLSEHVKVLKKVNLHTEVKEHVNEANLSTPKAESQEAQKSEARVDLNMFNYVAETVVPAGEHKEHQYINNSPEVSPIAKVEEPEVAKQPEETAVFQLEEEKSAFPAIDSKAVAEPPETAAIASPQTTPAVEIPKVEEPVVKEVVIPEKTTSIEVPAEVIVSSSASTPPTVNDIISAQKAQSAPTPKFSQPIADLKTAINLNDKLLFIKDLFNGYSLAYSEAIDILNRFDSFEAAENFLKTNYAVKNNWISKQATVDKFYELLNRRYLK